MNNILIYLGILFHLLCALPTEAAGKIPATTEHERHFNAACKIWPGVPQNLALAIARHESGMNPWAVNVAGRGFMPGSKAEALRLADYAWRKGLSFDVGLMQVNSAWLRKLGITPELALEPRANVILGVWILDKEIKRHGLNWRAVASYHTPVDRNPERGKRYVLAVLRQLNAQKLNTQKFNAQQQSREQKP